MDKQFEKFLEVFKKHHINIPFAEALEQMPSYAKFMIGILSRKVKLDRNCRSHGGMQCCAAAEVASEA